MESLLCQEHVTISEPCHLPVAHHFLPWVNGKNDVIGLLKKWICQCLTWDMYSIKNTCIIKELTLRSCYWAVPCYFNFEAEYWYTNPRIITVSTCLCYIACVTLLGEVRTRNRGGGWDCLWHIHCLFDHSFLVSYHGLWLCRPGLSLSACVYREITSVSETS